VPTTTSPCTYAPFPALPPGGGGLARGFKDSGHLVTLPRPGSDANQLSAAYFEVFVVVVYYESRKRELKIRLVNEGRCDERLKARVEESTCLDTQSRRPRQGAADHCFMSRRKEDAALRKWPLPRYCLWLSPRV
jgi:hypothetical protein